MADHLSQILSQLSSAERRHCRAYLVNNKVGKIGLKIFDAQAENKIWTPPQLAEHVYGDKNKTANLRAARKRITDQVIDFVASRRKDQDPSPSATVRNTLNFAEMMMERHDVKFSLHYLDEAQRNAEDSHRYDLIEAISHYRLLHAVPLGIDALEAYRSWEGNHQRYRTYMHLLAAEGILQQQLMEMRRLGRVPDQEELMQTFYERFAAHEEERMNPVFMYKLAVIFRRVMLSTKDYWRVEPSVREMYETLLANNRFNDSNREIEMGFLFMIAQAAYRNRHFTEAEKYLNEIRQRLPVPTPRNHPWYVKMISLQSALYGYTSRAKEAIRLLEKHLYGENPIIHVMERCNMQLNLALCRYCDGNLQGADEQIRGMEQRDEWLYEQFGVEWIYKKRMIHLIILWDLGHYEHAEKMLRDMLSDYASFLEQDIYVRAKTFMHFVLRYFENPEIITERSFHLEIRDAHLGWGDKEDIHAITFFCWLRAKMLSRPFYSVLQMRLKEDGDGWDYPFSLK